MRARRLITPACACLASFAAAGAATAALAPSSPRTTGTASRTTTTGTAATPTTARTVTIYQRYTRASKGEDGRTGARGDAGPAGAPGPPRPGGPAGPRGQQRILVTPVSLNWQNNRPAGRATAAFTAPGIGEGLITCTPNIPNVADDGAQYLEFTPYDLGMDTTVASYRTDDRPFTFLDPSRPFEDDPAAAAERPVTVKFANLDRENQKTLREGFNLKAFSATYRAQGSMTGIISQRGRRGQIGGPVTAKPTTFRLAWHWVFDDGNPRCYVAGAFYTEAS